MIRAAVSTDTEPATRATPDKNLGTHGTSAARILAPLGVEEFRNQYWGQRALYLPGFASKFEFLFDEDRFHAAVRRCHAMQTLPGQFRLRAFKLDDGSGLTLGRDIAPTDIDAALAVGETICVNDISAGDDDLAFYADEFRRALGHAGHSRFNSYRSRQGGGASLHFDRRIACTLQISGNKRWRYARQPALSWPRVNAQADLRGAPRHIGPGGLDAWEQLEPVRASDLEEVRLSPGDLLCLPAGTWHDTCSEGDSLALNLTSGPLGFSEVMRLALQTALEHEPVWRSVPAIGAVEGEESWPPEALAYCRERLQEAAEVLQRLQRDPRQLLRAWSILGRL
jgi:ribosomal protein L16 Arg81 hydroxylase